MGKRLANTAICIFAAVVAGAVSDAAVEILRSPNILSRPEYLWEIVREDTFLYVALPVALLALGALFKPNRSFGLSILVPVGWLTVIFAWWVYKPLVHHGVFPWWGFRLHYLGMLPVSLSVGLVFALCTRMMVGRITSSSDLESDAAKPSLTTDG